VKNWLLGIAALAVAVYAFYPLESPWSTPAEGVTVLQFWHPWTGQYAEDLAEVIAEFNRTHPRIQVNALFMPTGAGENMKFFVSVAGGVPPDVVFVDGAQVASWAAMGVLRPLNDLMAETGVSRDDYFEPSWRQCEYNGKAWAIPAAADPNFALVWNKHFFRQAGLDPERPPRTIQELEDYALKLTVFDKKGEIERLGFLPTFVPHGSIAVLTWGWAFGAKFYDERTQQFTCDDPHAIEALKWILHMQKLYGGQERILNFESGFGFSAQEPFIQRDLAMSIAYIAYAQDILRFAPDLEFGIGPMPVKQGVTPGSEWIGGWTMAIPYGTRGHEKQAFELIRWMCADKVGTRYMGKTMKLLPAFRKSPFFEKDIEEGRPDDPEVRVLKAFYEILQRAKRVRPVTPVSAYYMSELMRALGRARNGSLTPEQALKEAREKVTEEWLKVKARAQARHVRAGSPSAGQPGK
jgi:multiple sugar transport system substrate-binding protein